MYFTFGFWLHLKKKEKRFILFTEDEFNWRRGTSSITEAVYWNFYQTFALVKRLLMLMYI